ncbi:MAG: apolipoprotein N-acyltransferase [Candidatus Nanopelagicales bacterium]
MKYLGALFLGVVAGFAFQLEIPLVVLVLVLAGMFALTFRSTGKQWVFQWSLFGFSQFFVGLNWLNVVGVDIVILVSMFCSLSFISASLVANVLKLSLDRTLIFVITLTLFENIRDSFPFGGFGWLQYGMALIDTPLMIFHRALPQLLMTLLVLGTSALIGLSLFNVLSKRHYVYFAVSSVLLSGVSLINLVEIDESQIFTVVAVQGGVERYGLGVLGDRTEVLKNHIEITRENANAINSADLVVWPENSLDVDPKIDLVAKNLLSQIDEIITPPILLGSVLSPTNASRSNTSLELDGGITEIYTKQRLVPFGEFLPYRDFATSITERAALLPYDFVAGNTPGVWKRDGLQVSIGICFEVADSQIVHEDVEHSDFILIQTNNATYQFSNQSEQQLLYAKIRSIETGRPLISASTSGISALISDNVVLQTIGKGEKGVIAFEVNNYSGKTITSTLVGYAGWIVFVLWLMSCGVALRRRSK